MVMELQNRPNDALMNEVLAAEFIGVSRRTLQGWRLRGEGPRYHRISSRCIRYSRSLLQEWLRKTEISNTSEQHAK